MNNEEIKFFYDNGLYLNIIKLLDEPNKECYQDALIYAILIYTKLGEPQKAADCYKKVNISENLAIRGEIYRCMGLSYYLMGNYELANKLFADGKKRGDQESNLWCKLLFPLLTDYRETESINFRFIDSPNPVEKKALVMKSLKSYLRIAKFIGSKQESKKIDIYIYLNRYDSIGNPLSYADNALKVIHTYVNDANGHEIAHILFNNIYRNMRRNSFIDEGIATFFDEDVTLSDYFLKHKDCMKVMDLNSVWEASNSKFGDSMSDYYFAGAFVGWLLYSYGREPFLKFIRDESIEHAKQVLDPSLVDQFQMFYNEISNTGFCKYNHRLEELF